MQTIRNNADIITTIMSAIALAAVRAPWPLWTIWAVVVAAVITWRVRR